jgi:peptidoglycan hydrolase-like protein with peptidoglycan-binding domain
MPNAVRRLLPFALAGLVLVVTAPAAAAVDVLYPTQSLGDRGVDVKAIQGLLTHRGFQVAVDGVFGPATHDRVVAFQAAGGLTADGVVREATWAKLIVTLGQGSTGEAVKVVQRQLNQKRFADLDVTGRFGAGTVAAVKAFQRHVGMTANGRVGPATWRHLLWHYDYPTFKSGTLCDYSAGNGRANWGTGSAIGLLEAGAALFATMGYGRIAVGDISREHGGTLAGHETHKVGLDVDVRPIRNAENQCDVGTSWRLASYDRAATRALVKSIRATAPGHVKVIYFNDPVLIREGLTTWFGGHDDHIHVRYCERWHPRTRYRC